MPDREAWKTWEGRVIAGKFPLRRWLGGSDQSAVFLTEGGNPSSPLAIKLTAAGANAESELSRLRAAAQLSHPNLIRIFESGADQNQDTPILYAVTELADDDLSRILPDRALSASEVGDMLLSVLDVLSYLHGNGLAHGHLAPSNVMAVGDLLKLSSDQITPFSQPAQAEFARSGRTCRDAYDAPEIASGNFSPASDLWSLGATLVTALTQNPPAVDESWQRDPLVPKTMADPFRGIARECLHVDPKRRCSITEIRARLETSSRSVPAAEPPAPQPASPHRSSWRILIPLAVVLATIVGFLVLRRDSKPSTNLPAATTPQAALPAASPVAPSTPPPPSSSKGAAVHKVLPEIPAQARHTISGTIRIAVRVQVDASGAVTNAELADSGPSPYFASRTLQAARQWEFAAPRANGQPVASTWLLHFRIKRNSTQADAAPVRH